MLHQANLSSTFLDVYLSSAFMQRSMTFAFCSYPKEAKAFEVTIVMLDAVLLQQRVQLFSLELVSTWMSLRLLKQSPL
jgi:hypothetical protein